MGLPSPANRSPFTRAIETSLARHLPLWQGIKAFEEFMDLIENAYVTSE
jgi:hypothetical protein